MGKFEAQSDALRSSLDTAVAQIMESLSVSQEHISELRDHIDASVNFTEGRMALVESKLDRIL